MICLKRSICSIMKIKALILLLCVPLPEAFAKVYGPIGQWYEDPSTSMAIHWVQENFSSDTERGGEADTKDLDFESSLSYRPEGQEKWIASQVTNRLFGNTKNRVCSADLKKLTPDTHYTFKIRQGEKGIGIWFFKTAPLKIGNGITFVTGGDMFHSRELLDAMNLRAGTEDPLFALLGGDLAYANGVDANRWLEWLESWSQFAKSPNGTLIPMIVVIGNHEVRGAAYRPTNAPPKSEAPYFYSLFYGFDKGSKYAIDFGDYMTVVALDSGHTENIAAQVQWLNKTLEEKGKFTYKFSCYHRPAWGAGVKEDAVDIQRLWSPVFERHRVDAIFENDHHVYKRTYPLTAGKRDDMNGVMYIGDGAWGTRTRGIAGNWKAKRPFLAHAESVNHLIKVKVENGKLTYKALEADGSIIDEYQRINLKEK